jgi:O-antigen ligase
MGMQRITGLDVLFYAYIVSVPLEIVGTMLLGLPFSLSVPFGIAFVVAYVVRYALSDGRTRRATVPWPLWLMVLFVVFLFGRYAVSPEYGYWRYVVAILNNVMLAIVAYNYLLQSRNCDKSLLLLGVVIVLAGTLLLLSGALTTEEISKRSSILEYDENYFGSVLGLGAMIVITRLLRKKAPWPVSLLLLGLAMMAVTVMLTTGSRGAFASFSLSAIGYACVVNRRAIFRTKNMIIVGLVVTCTVILALHSEVFRDRWGQTLELHGGGAFSGRDTIWTVAVDMFMEKPLFGWGVGEGFVELGQRIRGEYGPVATHNAVLFSGLAGGVSGLACFVPFFFYPFALLTRCRKSDLGGQLIALYAYVALVMMSLDWLDAKVFWLLYSIVLASCRQVQVVIVQRTIECGCAEITCR